MWMKPYNSMTRQIPNKFCCCCTRVSVHIHICIYLSDAGQRRGLWNTSTVDCLLRRIQELGLNYSWWGKKIQVLSLIQNHYGGLCWDFWSQFSCGDWLSNLVFLTWRSVCQGAWTLATRPIVGMANSWQLKQKSLSHGHNGIFLWQYEQI